MSLKYYLGYSVATAIQAAVSILCEEPKVIVGCLSFYVGFVFWLRETQHAATLAEARERYHPIFGNNEEYPPGPAPVIESDRPAISLTV